jgi:hypothetical protein
MKYMTVFEITQTPFRGDSLRFDLVFVALRNVLVLLGKRWAPQERARIAGWRVLYVRVV